MDYDTQHALEQKSKATNPEEKHQEEAKASKAKAKKATKSGGKGKAAKSGGLEPDFEDA